MSAQEAHTLHFNETNSDACYTAARQSAHMQCSRRHIHIQRERDEENVNSWNSHDAEMEQQLHSKFMLMPRPGINFFALSERHFDL